MQSFPFTSLRAFSSDWKFVASTAQKRTSSCFFPSSNEGMMPLISEITAGRSIPMYSLPSSAVSIALGVYPQGRSTCTGNPDSRASFPIV